MSLALLVCQRVECKNMVRVVFGEKNQTTVVSMFFFSKYITSGFYMRYSKLKFYFFRLPYL